MSPNLGITRKVFEYNRTLFSLVENQDLVQTGSEKFPKFPANCGKFAEKLMSFSPILRYLEIYKIYIFRLISGYLINYNLTFLFLFFLLCYLLKRYGVKND